MPKTDICATSQPQTTERPKPEALGLLARLRKVFSMTDAQAQTLAQIKFPCC
ncbi:hypothetical protein [Donghicola sp.]|uniref:hypothetical protein n=1 Tax=Donghicola sp. TaxID=1929294 RepID=UPI0025EEA7C9|nr:hypothetical protein [Donghicola sp.]MCT4578877.1 hypothetical protein [Donghicola sp.]